MTITIDQRDWQKVLAEIVGTFFFFFIGIGGAIVAGNAPVIGSQGVLANISALSTLYIALAHGVALAIAISALGHVSGGHFNPAVTIGMMVARKISPALGLLYIFGQLVGGLLACLLLVVLL